MLKCAVSSQGRMGGVISKLVPLTDRVHCCLISWACLCTFRGEAEAEREGFNRRQVLLQSLRWVPLSDSLLLLSHSSVTPNSVHGDSTEGLRFVGKCAGEKKLVAAPSTKGVYVPPVTHQQFVYHEPPSQGSTKCCQPFCSRACGLGAHNNTALRQCCCLPKFQNVKMRPKCMSHGHRRIALLLL